MCCIKGCLSVLKYFQTKAVFKVLYCLERVFLRTWELAFPVRRFFRSQRSVKISWNSEIWNNTNLSLNRTYQLRVMASTLGMRTTMSMDATIRVIWLCVCLRYWPLHGCGTCASVLKLDLKYRKIPKISPENGEKSPDNLLCRGPNSTSVVRSFCNNQPFLTKELMLLLLSIYQRASIWLPR